MQIRSRVLHRLKKLVLETTTLFRVPSIFFTGCITCTVIIFRVKVCFIASVDGIRLWLLIHYWSITSRYCVVVVTINSLRLPLVVSLGHSLIWSELVRAGEQFCYFAKEYLFGHGNPKSSVKVSVAQSSFVLLKALFPKTKFKFRMLKVTQF